MKKCSKCGEYKTLDSFGSRRKDFKDGKRIVPLTYCKKCNSEASKKHYRKIKEEGIKYVYRFLNKYDEVIYVGKTEALAHRISSHFSRSHLPKECYEELSKIQLIPMKSMVLMDIKELYYINLYKPKYNSDHIANEPSFIIEGLGGDKWIDLENLKEAEVVEVFESEVYKKSATIFSRKRGKNYLVYLEMNVEGKRKQIKQGSFKTKKGADTLVEKLRQERKRADDIISK